MLAVRASLPGGAASIWIMARDLCLRRRAGVKTERNAAQALVGGAQSGESQGRAVNSCHFPIVS